ncbi:MAG: DUF3626 domain-containing protein [Chloroflexi bacterium]|nr:DUF3626 domain-containing protein [Chloroflexota bacterium]
MGEISPIQRALNHVTTLSHGEPLDPSLRITLQFHPDRRSRDGRPLLTALRQDGCYRSQFETGTSNGGLTAYPGGERWRWESRIFAGAYDRAPAALRPKYGALNVRHKAIGGAPRYRGHHVVELGLRLAHDGHLDARVIGDAVRQGVDDEHMLKRVWHYVARFGESAD